MIRTYRRYQLVLLAAVLGIIWSYNIGVWTWVLFVATLLAGINAGILLVFELDYRESSKILATLEAVEKKHGAEGEANWTIKVDKKEDK